MRKKIIIALVLSLFILPVLSGAKDQDENNPFDRIWNAIEGMQSRLDAEENSSVNQSDYEQGIGNLQGQIDGLNCQLSGGDTCALDGDDENSGGDDNGGSTSPISCGIGVCSRSVQADANGIFPECIPGEPTPEVCDGLDNNCDGETDEDAGDLGGSCSDNNGGSGILVCDEQGGVMCLIQQ